MGKLRQVMQAFVDILRKFDNFSEVVHLIIKDFLVNCKERFGINITNFDPLNDDSVQIVHTALSIVFEPLCHALKDPQQYCLLVEVSFVKTEANFNSLSSTVSAFFSGIELGESNERWLNEINAFNMNEDNLTLKIEILTKLLNRKVDLEELYLESLFTHSLAPFDKTVTVNGQLLIYLHQLVAQNLNSLRVNNPSYDPLTLICNAISPVPPIKTFSKNEFINLSLLTRSLRYDQSIVRCPDCEMLISRDMSPNNFRPVIELYDPMPPNSSTSILTHILATGPKKQKKGRVDEYIKCYQNNYYFFLKNFEVNEKVKILLTNVDTLTSASLGIPIEAVEDEERNLIEQNREECLKEIECECEYQYKRRKQHCVVQYRISRILNHLFSVLSNKLKTSVIDQSHQSQILFNVEYGACNIELEKFSDSVMFSIFMNKIREYTSKKEMSINLFENLTEEMKDSLRGFMKRTLNELVNKGVIKEFSLANQYKRKDVVFSFEVEADNLIIIAAESPNK